MKGSARERIEMFLKGKPDGWVFSIKDIELDLPRFAVDQAFVALEEKGLIARAIRGIYYKPRYNSILKRNAPPDVREVAEAIARKFCWTLAPDDDVALNRLQLSTQVQARYAFKTSGPSRVYKVGNRVVEFRHRCLRETERLSPETLNVIRAMKALGKSHISPELVASIRSQYPEAQWQKICRESAHASDWIRRALEGSRE